ncbi:MAG: GIY-YIG nuclease family protein [Lachnospiraceae bacterium]|nr:GIY-YIG nuclease family protein [Lachnospiraceae bacterium]
MVSGDVKAKTRVKETYAYTYIVECGDGSLYTGWTNHLEERLESHNQGKGAKYTRSRLPVRLVHYEVFATKQEAMKREYAIKQLSRKDKLILIENQSVEVRTLCDDVATKINKHMVDL